MSEASSKKPGKSRSNGHGPNPLSIIPSTIPLIIRLGFVYLRFKGRAKKAGKVFKKEMIANGVDRTTAKLLAEEYVNASRIFHNFDFSDMMKGKSEEEMIAEYAE